MFRVQRRNGAKHLNLFISDGITIQAGGSLHREESHDLKHVVLHHIPDRAGVIVELSPALDAELFCHGDLHALDVIPVPNRFQKAVGKAKE